MGQLRLRRDLKVIYTGANAAVACPEGCQRSNIEGEAKEATVAVAMILCFLRRLFLEIIGVSAFPEISCKF